MEKKARLVIIIPPDGCTLIYKYTARIAIMQIYLKYFHVRITKAKFLPLIYFHYVINYVYIFLSFDGSANENNDNRRQ